ncbi:glyoxalase [Paraburkholderia dipogonis]|uniref:Glyoxalase n=1 Tax=Paraburkholderia dipogonis TaxID=1211383 RepID=A0A4Y8MSE7_9BURK|nr:VOC family protein [Paraburkholderia dipogonis]TFE40417.1 glyoxalase [Paraburkholderia dipogonis]
MNIIGLDELAFGVDDVGACAQFLMDYGLQPVGLATDAGRFEALDGTAITIRHKGDPALPPPLATATMLRKTVYGVADEATLHAIADELGRDRTVTRHADGSLETVDDVGFVLGFQVTRRRSLNLPAETVNAPGAPAGRPINVVAADEQADALPRTLSHVVCFVPDVVKAEEFYVDRLGFVCTDRFTGVGPFLRPAGTPDHHALFLLQTPPFMQGCEHFTFHLGGPTELMQAGTRFAGKGYQSFWGPGRHKFGSNWFWYFNSPLGCHVEYDADMDLHDERWAPREAEAGADTSQLFLFAAKERWAPGRPSPKNAEHG